MRITSRLATMATLAITVATGTGLAGAMPASASATEIPVTLRVQVAPNAGGYIDSFETSVVNVNGGTYKTYCDSLQPGAAFTTKEVTARPGERVRVLSTVDCYAVVGKHQSFDVTAPTTELDVFLRADRFE
jgi:hypothetical protein